MSILQWFESMVKEPDWECFSTRDTSSESNRLFTSTDLRGVPGVNDYSALEIVLLILAGF